MERPFMGIGSRHTGESVARLLHAREARQDMGWREMGIEYTKMKTWGIRSAVAIFFLWLIAGILVYSLDVSWSRWFNVVSYFAGCLVGGILKRNIRK